MLWTHSKLSSRQATKKWCLPKSSTWLTITKFMSFVFSRLRDSRRSYMTGTPSRLEATSSSKWDPALKASMDRLSWESCSSDGLITRSWSNGCRGSSSTSIDSMLRWVQLQVWQTRDSHNSRRKFSGACLIRSRKLSSFRLRQIEKTKRSTPICLNR